MTQHTPGPWKTIATTTHPLRIVNRESTIVCNVLADADTMPECTANARLIAAAPELLELLEAAYDRFTDNDMQPPNHELKKWLTQVEAVFDSLGKSSEFHLTPTDALR